MKKSDIEVKVERIEKFINKVATIVDKILYIVKKSKEIKEELSKE